jgi:hypothetical protein
MPQRFAEDGLLQDMSDNPLPKACFVVPCIGLAAKLRLPETSVAVL